VGLISVEYVMEIELAESNGHVIDAWIDESCSCMMSQW